MAAASAARAIGSDRSIARGYRLLAPPQKAEASQSDQRDDPGALQRPIPTQEHVYKQDRPGKDQRVHGAKTGESAGTIAVPWRSCAPVLAREMKTPPEGGALEHRQMGSNWTYRTSLATRFGASD